MGMQINVLLTMLVFMQLIQDYVPILLTIFFLYVLRFIFHHLLAVQSLSVLPMAILTSQMFWLASRPLRSKLSRSTLRAPPAGLKLSKSTN